MTCNLLFHGSPFSMDLLLFSLEQWLTIVWNIMDWYHPFSWLDLSLSLPSLSFPCLGRKTMEALMRKITPNPIRMIASGLESNSSSPVPLSARLYLISRSSRAFYWNHANFFRIMHVSIYFHVGSCIGKGICCQYHHHHHHHHSLWYDIFSLYDCHHARLSLLQLFKIIYEM